VVHPITYLNNIYRNDVSTVSTDHQRGVNSLTYFLVTIILGIVIWWMTGTVNPGVQVNTDIGAIIVAVGVTVSNLIFHLFRALVSKWNNGIMVVLAFFALKIFLYLIIAVTVLLIWPAYREYSVFVLLVSYFFLTIFETWMKWKHIQNQN
jgi:hypothetical protein